MPLGGIVRADAWSLLAPCAKVCWSMARAYERARSVRALYHRIPEMPQTRRSEIQARISAGGWNQGRT